jgi:hypothetical protein
LLFLFLTSISSPALAIGYKRPVLWRSPTFQSQRPSAAPPSMAIALRDVSTAGLVTDHYPNNYLSHDWSCNKSVDKNCTQAFDCSAGTKIANGTRGDLCAWGTLTFNVSSCAKPDPRSKLCPPVSVCRRPPLHYPNQISTKSTPNLRVTPPHRSTRRSPSGRRPRWSSRRPPPSK